MILLVSFDIYYFLIGHFDYGTQTKNYGEETKTPAFRTSNYIFRKLEDFTASFSYLRLQLRWWLPFSGRPRHLLLE